MPYQEGPHVCAPCASTLQNLRTSPAKNGKRAKLWGVFFLFFFAARVAKSGV